MLFTSGYYVDPSYTMAPPKLGSSNNTDQSSPSKACVSPTSQSGSKDIPPPTQEELRQKRLAFLQKQSSPQQSSGASGSAVDAQTDAGQSSEGEQIAVARQ